MSDFFKELDTLYETALNKHQLSAESGLELRYLCILINSHGIRSGDATLIAASDTSFANTPTGVEVVHGIEAGYLVWMLGRLNKIYNKVDLECDTCHGGGLYADLRLMSHFYGNRILFTATSAKALVTQCCIMAICATSSEEIEPACNYLSSLLSAC